jgi:hypothetical protein
MLNGALSLFAVEKPITVGAKVELLHLHEKEFLSIFCFNIEKYL